MKTLVIKTLVMGTATNVEATPLFLEMKKCTDSNTPITLSFVGVDYVSSSFLNSSVGEFIELFGYNYFAENVKFTGCNHDLASMIKTYVVKSKATVN